MRIAIFFTLIAGITVTLGLIWLLLGPRISTIIDSWFPDTPAAQPTQPIHPMSIEFDPAGISSRFTLGSRAWPLSWPWLPGPSELKTICDGLGRLVLYADGKAFTFGPVQQVRTDPVKPQFLFVPESGDVVSFSRDVSRLPWPTPFTFNVLGAPVPKLKRYAYDRLRWTKPSGAVLQITWRDEYWFYPGSGWTDSFIDRLHKVSVRASPSEAAAAKYLTATKKWHASEYHLEIPPTQSTDDLCEVNVIYLKDESATHPGAGKSVKLRVSKSSEKVVGETAWQ